MNRQGPDVGTQYRSAIFYLSPNKNGSRVDIARSHSSELSKPIATEITAASTFYRAEEYHQRYFERHEIACHVPTL